MQRRRRACHTPGHADGHLVLRGRRRDDRRGHGRGHRHDLDRSRARATWREYLASLERLLARPAATLLPAHGPVIADGPRASCASTSHTAGCARIAWSRRCAASADASLAELVADRLRRHADACCGRSRSVRCSRTSTSSCGTARATRGRARGDGRAASALRYSGAPVALTFDALAEVALARDLLRRWWGLELGFTEPRRRRLRAHVARDVRDAARRGGGGVRRRADASSRPAFAKRKQTRRGRPALPRRPADRRGAGARRRRARRRRLRDRRRAPARADDARAGRIARDRRDRRRGAARSRAALPALTDADLARVRDLVDGGGGRGRARAAGGDRADDVQRIRSPRSSATRPRCATS